MMMRVDEARRDDAALCVDDLFTRQRRQRADLGDHAIHDTHVTLRARCLALAACQNALGARDEEAGHFGRLQGKKIFCVKATSWNSPSDMTMRMPRPAQASGNLNRDVENWM